MSFNNTQNKSKSTRIALVVRPPETIWTTKKQIMADWHANRGFASIIRRSPDSSTPTLVIHKNDPIADKYPVVVQYMSRGRKATVTVNE